MLELRRKALYAYVVVVNSSMWLALAGGVVFFTG